jgi:hypothetical protein
MIPYYHCHSKWKSVVLKMKWLIFSGFLALSLIAVLSLLLLHRKFHSIMIIYGIFIATILNDTFFTIFEL